jgi:hypothetical protein
VIKYQAIDSANPLMRDKNLKEPDDCETKLEFP